VQRVGASGDGSSLATVIEDTDVSRGEKLARAISNLAAWKIAVFFVALGVVLLLLSVEFESGDGPSAVDATVRELGALFVVTGAVSTLWDLHGRRALSNEVLAAARISADVQAAGVTRLVMGYHEMDWDEHLRASYKVDLFFTYAQTWRNTHATELRRLVRREGARLRVVLPDPDCQPLVTRLAEKFRYDSADLAMRIRDAIGDFQNLRQQTPNSDAVQVRLTREFPVYTYYGFDRACVTVLYAPTPGRTEVPAFETADGGFLHRFFRDQFEELWEGSTPSE
jgi:hypothetical protein